MGLNLSDLIMLISVLALLLSNAATRCASAREGLDLRGSQGQLHSPALPQDLPNVTWSGYLPLANGTHDAIFYSYYTAQQPETVNHKSSDPPIVIWLQVSASMPTKSALDMMAEPLASSHWPAWSSLAATYKAAVLFSELQ